MRPRTGEAYSVFPLKIFYMRRLYVKTYLSRHLQYIQALAPLACSITLLHHCYPFCRPSQVFYFTVCV